MEHGCNEGRSKIMQLMILLSLSPGFDKLLGYPTIRSRTTGSKWIQSNLNEIERNTLRQGAMVHGTVALPAIGLDKTCEPPGGGDDGKFAGQVRALQLGIATYGSGSRAPGAPV